MVPPSSPSSQVKESAGSETRERVYVTAAETHDLSGSKGSANFVSREVLWLPAVDSAAAAAAQTHTAAKEQQTHHTHRTHPHNRP